MHTYLKKDLVYDKGGITNHGGKRKYYFISGAKIAS